MGESTTVMGKSLKRLWNQTAHTPCFRCMCMYDCEEWMDLAGAWWGALGGGVELCHWRNCMPSVALCSQCDLWEASSEVLSKQIWYYLSFCACHYVCYGALDKLKSSFIAPELWSPIDHCWSKSATTVLVPQQQTFLLLLPNKIAASQKTIYRKKYLLTPSNRFCCLCCQTRPQLPQRLLIGKSGVPCAWTMGFAAFAVKSDHSILRLSTCKSNIPFLWHWLDHAQQAIWKCINQQGIFQQNPWQ